MLVYLLWMLRLSFLTVKSPYKIGMAIDFLSRSKERASISFIPVLLELAKLIFWSFIYFRGFFFYFCFVFSSWRCFGRGCLFGVWLSIFSFDIFFYFWLRKWRGFLRNYRRFNFTNQKVLNQNVSGF